MFWFGVVLLAIGYANALSNHKLHPLSDEYIQEINNKQSTWKAGRNFAIKDYELFKILANGVKDNGVPRIYENIHNEDEDVPESFDSREAWPECADIIEFIQDQSRCGSCWAFSSVEAMSDRICIHSNGTKKMLVSAENLLACGATEGCHGGWPDQSFSFWQSDGIVTGGLYNRTDQGCQSYFLPPCDRSTGQCVEDADSPACRKECDDSTLNYEGQKTYGQNVQWLQGENQMQLEIFKNGPIVAVIQMFADFASYKSGIYQVTTDQLEGLHAIKIIGWGVENGIKYWTVANSFGTSWGDNGFFKILRGQDEANIEQSYGIVAGLPDFSRF